MYLVYPLVLLYRFLGGQDWFSALWVAGLGFGLVSLFRYLLNQPRPYETWDIDPLIAKDTKGQSMPSRHVFSAVMVAMVVYQSLPWLGGIFLVLALLLALVRVLGGVHYAKDVLVAYLLALAWSSLLWV